MDNGVCILSVVPVRAEPNDRSEQVTQLLFGELVIILEKREKWLFVQSMADNYQGWVCAGQIKLFDRAYFDDLINQETWVSTDLVQVLRNTTQNYSMLATAGSSFYQCRQNRFTLVGNEWEYLGAIRKVGGFEPEMIIDLAMLFLHIPYMWGGRSAMGMDCSGFTQIVFKMAGKPIHRDASQQATQGELINLIHEAEPGDLLFFDNDEGAIIHTGILLPGNNIIHAHQKVRIDKVDHHGIFNTDQSRYSHKLRIIKRFSN